MSLAKAQETFFYDDSSGELFWKIRPSKSVMWGDRAGHVNKSVGYYRLRFEGKLYSLHNLIWNFHYGEIPTGKEVDHRDKDPLNNKISNLRLATRRQQRINTRSRGFYWHKNDERWRAQHELQRKSKHLGSFTTALQARLAYEKHTSALEPEFASTFFTDAINRLIIEGA